MTPSPAPPDASLDPPCPTLSLATNEPPILLPEPARKSHSCALRPCESPIRAPSRRWGAVLIADGSLRSLFHLVERRDRAVRPERRVAEGLTRAGDADGPPAGVAGRVELGRDVGEEHDPRGVGGEGRGDGLVRRGFALRAGVHGV